jgi:hypothetical protein
LPGLLCCIFRLLQHWRPQNRKATSDNTYKNVGGGPGGSASSGCLPRRHWSKPDPEEDREGPESFPLRRLGLGSWRLNQTWQSTVSWYTWLWLLGPGGLCQCHLNQGCCVWRWLPCQRFRHRDRQGSGRL